MCRARGPAADVPRGRRPGSQAASLPLGGVAPKTWMPCPCGSAGSVRWTGPMNLNGMECVQVHLTRGIPQLPGTELELEPARPRRWASSRSRQWVAIAAVTSVTGTVPVLAAEQDLDPRSTRDSDGRCYAHISPFSSLFVTHDSLCSWESFYRTSDSTV